MNFKRSEISASVRDSGMDVHIVSMVAVTISRGEEVQTINITMMLIIGIVNFVLCLYSNKIQVVPMNLMQLLH